MGLAPSLALSHRGVLRIEADAARLAEKRNAQRRERRRQRRTQRTTHYTPREERVRTILQTLTGLPWDKARPDFLRGEKGHNLELDCYSPVLNAAFECQGLQHSKFIRHFHKHKGDFEEMVRRDRLKAALCREHGVKLVCVPAREHLCDSQLTLWIMRSLEREVGFRAGPINQSSCLAPA